MTESLPIGFHDTISDPEVEYRAIEPLAVVGLLIGLLSAMALVDAPWWLVPCLGAAVSLLALRRIASDPGRTGRAAALAGLALSVFFLLMAVVQVASAAAVLAPQARPIAQQWFDFLKEDSPEKAMMMTFPPDRQVYDEGRWQLFRTDFEARERLGIFVRNPLVKTLLALGDKAQVRYYATEGLGTHGVTAKAVLVYAVTFPEGAGKKTFLVRISLIRDQTHRSWVNPWHVDTFELVVNPLDR